jgi:hypothetical protein
MNPEKNPSGLSLPENEGAGSESQTEQLWVPVIDQRRNQPFRAELNEGGGQLGAAVAEGVTQKRPGSALGMALLNPANGVVVDDEVDTWGGALLQTALESAFQTYKGSPDDLIRETQEFLAMARPDLKGIEKLADIARGARSTVEYIRSHPLGAGERRFSSVELDVMAKVDLVEVATGVDGLADEVRFVQVKSSVDSAKISSEDVFGAHQKVLNAYPEALAAVLAVEEAVAERDGSKIAYARFEALAEAMASGSVESVDAAFAANPQAHLALTLGRDVPGFRKSIFDQLGPAAARALATEADERPVSTFLVRQAAVAAGPDLASLMRSGDRPTRFVSVVTAAGQEVSRKALVAPRFGETVA